MTKIGQQEQQVIQLEAGPNQEPGVFYVNYNEGDDFQVGDLSLQEVLAQQGQQGTSCCWRKWKWIRRWKWLCKWIWSRIRKCIRSWIRKCIRSRIWKWKWSSSGSGDTTNFFFLESI
ncbi:UNVERIFIED_CONTAM: hypothetical protein GTU68_031945 [Idotea baltica]|nr:hypothetical protein [Idotea baltica]